MIDKLIAYSIRNKLVVGLFILALIGWGSFSLRQIPIDAVPDITTNQVQIMTHSPTLAAQEVEQFITFPIEIAMSNLPGVTEIRSISRFGISVITVVFEDDVDIYRARQLISEQLKQAESDIPDGFGKPNLGPITTGLGEVYQYVLRAEDGFKGRYSDMELRTINDWIVKRQLAGTPGVIEVSGWGGHLKQYEVALDPSRLHASEVSIAEVFQALQRNNQNTGGSYIERSHTSYFIRGEGLVKSLSDIEKIVVKNVNGIPLLIRDIGSVGYGYAPRYGAVTANGEGEVVGGQVLMLKGANSYETVQAVKERIEQIRSSLPEGVVLEPFIDRSKLIGNAIATVSKNLIEGGLIVILVLVLLLGNLRGGLIVASVIPLSMMFAVGMMNLFGISANLMSLGAIDFGLVVDGSVIIVEAILHRLQHRFNGQHLSKDRMDEEVLQAAGKIRSSAAFGEIIILIVYLPILALVGIEGKMFGPMAQTVSFAILGALLLSMTYVPMMSALFLKRSIKKDHGPSDKFIGFLQKLHQPTVQIALKYRALVVGSVLVVFGMSVFTFNRLGGEFIPTLEEGDFALHQILPPGSSLAQSVAVSSKIQKALLDNFPEVEMAVSKIGTSEIATDPMPIEVGDIILRMKPMDEWVTAQSREEMFEKMEAVLSEIPGVGYEFTQPIQMRFNELIAGVREDIAIKIFGEDPEVLHAQALKVEQIIASVPGLGDMRVEQTQGLPQMIVRYQREKIAQYGLNIADLNTLLRTAFAGEVAGVVLESERRFDLVVRLDAAHRQSLDDLKELFVPLPNGQKVPLKELATIQFEDGPMQISRENAKRRIVVGVNARNRDTQSLVQEIQERLRTELDLPAGYYIEYGGQFENLIAARARLGIAVPVALLLILVLLFFTFDSLPQALLIFTAIPMSAIGGVYALWLRDMPFSISAGIGFIALFGVAVLNGIVLISYFNQLKQEGVADLHQRILLGTQVRLRPVLLTAFVAALGFLPMALSSSAGAEVQRPLATVVIGGLVTATLLTLVVIPVLYSLLEEWKPAKSSVLPLLVVALLAAPQIQAQQQPVQLQDLVAIGRQEHPLIQRARAAVAQQENLQRTAWELDPTSVVYTYGQLNTAVDDYQWQVKQNLRFPTTYLRQDALQQALLNREKQQFQLSSLEWERQLRLAWWELALADARRSLVQEWAEVYRAFADAASKRLQAGEINKLERIRADAEMEQMLLLQQQLDADWRQKQAELLQWVGIDSAISLAEGALLEGIDQLPKMSDSVGMPWMQWEQQGLAVADQQYRLSKSRFLPDWNVGYFNQSIDGMPNMSGLSVGLDIPLFFWAQEGRAKAARAGRMMAQAQLEERQLQIKAVKNSLYEQLLKSAQEVAWYQNNGLPAADELLHFAQSAYGNGEIGYLEFLNSLQRARDIKDAHLTAVKNYQQLLTEWQFLTGQF